MLPSIQHHPSSIIQHASIQHACMDPCFHRAWIHPACIHHAWIHASIHASIHPASIQLGLLHPCPIHAPPAPPLDGRTLLPAKCAVPTLAAHRRPVPAAAPPAGPLVRQRLWKCRGQPGRVHWIHGIHGDHKGLRPGVRRGRQAEGGPAVRGIRPCPV